jgi:hypothetical protein
MLGLPLLGHRIHHRDVYGGMVNNTLEPVKDF